MTLPISTNERVRIRMKGLADLVEGTVVHFDNEHVCVKILNTNLVRCMSVGDTFYIEKI